MAASLLLYHDMLADPLHRSLGAGRGDPALFMWFLGWVPFALLHGHNPLLTNYLDYPDGVNLAWNTASPLAGLIAAPVTLTLGPVAAYNALMVLGPATTAWTARLWLGRHCSRPAAAILAGLFIGFSPDLVGHALGHLNFTLIPLVPVILMLLEDLLWRRPRPAWRSGLLLGLSVGAEGLLSEETVLLVAVGVALALASAVLLRPRAVLPAIAVAAPGLLLAAAAFLVVDSFLLYTQLFGPHRVSGVSGAAFSADPRDWVIPTDRMWLHGGDPTQRLAARGVNAFEVGGYLGWPLLAVLVLAVILLWRRWQVRVAALTAIGSMLFALGPELRLGGRPDGLPLPYSIIDGIPLIHNVLPLRYALVTSLAVGWLLAALLDAAAARNDRWRFVAFLAVGGALIPVIPASEPAGTPLHIPTFFASGAADIVSAGAPVVVLPLAEPHADEAMLWQAVAGMRFRLVGGYILRPADGSGIATPWPAGSPVVLVAHAASHALPIPESQLAAARQQLSDQHIRFLLVAKQPPLAAMRSAATALAGHPADFDRGGVLVWRLAASPTG